MPDDDWAAYERDMTAWRVECAEFGNLPSPVDMMSDNLAAVVEATRDGKAAPMLRAILRNQFNIYALLVGPPPEPQTPGERRWAEYAATPEAKRFFRQWLASGPAARKK